MKTSEDWSIEWISGQFNGRELIHFVESIQSDARQDLLERLQKAEASLSSFLKDSCDDDTAIRNLVRPILKPLECDGNSNGVPTPVDIVQTLVNRLQVMEKELINSNRVLKLIAYGCLSATEAITV
jgi:hypothetical protein